MVHHFRLGLSLATVEDSRKIKVFTADAQRTDYFPSIFSDGSYVKDTLKVRVEF